MATAYTTYSREAKKTVQYSFTCAHCGKQSAVKSFTITGVASQNIPGKGQLHPGDSALLESQAKANLDAAIVSKKKHVENGNYGGEIKGKCDSCGKRQAWEVKSAKLLPLWRSLSGLMLGFLLMAVVPFFDKSAKSYAAIFMPVGLIGGLIVGIVQFANIKIGTVKGAENSRPEIVW